MYALFPFVVFVIIVVALVMLSRKRTGFEAHSTALAQSLEGFKVLPKGGVFTNVRRSTKDAVEVFDFAYTSARVGSDLGQKIERTVLSLQSKQQTPHFFLRRQLRDLDAMAQQLGGQDINFDDDAAFSEKYVLQTFGDEAALRQFFTPALRAHFASLESRNLVVEGRGGVLLVHQGKLLTPTEFDALLEDALSIRGQWS